MTEHERKMIEYYIPHPRDPDLDPFEYYVKDSAGRVRRVYISDILPKSYQGADWTEYIVYEVSTNKRIYSWHKEEWRGFRKYEMYDSYQNCKEDTNGTREDWEKLRRLQEEEDAERETE